MGLVQNLMKTLSNTASKVLAELSSAFIRQRAKLILKKQDNSSTITSSQKSLTQESQGTTIATSSAGTTERTIMAEMTTEEIVSKVNTWAMDRVTDIMTSSDSSTEDIKNAIAIASEFDEWFDDGEQGGDIEIMSIEKY
jgi:hypothetical protein